MGIEDEDVLVPAAFGYEADYVGCAYRCHTANPLAGHKWPGAVLVARKIGVLEHKQQCCHHWAVLPNLIQSNLLQCLRIASTSIARSYTQLEFE